MEATLQVRATTEDDTTFLVSLALAAYRDVASRQFGSWNEGEQAARFAAKAARLPFEVGELDGQPVAAVSSSVHADHVFLNDLLVLPEFQNRGLGADLLEREIRRARRLGLPLRLHTLLLNRAVHLFERHGFVVTARGEAYIDMERAGQQGLGADSQQTRGCEGRETGMTDRTVVGKTADVLAAPMAGAGIEGVVKRVLISPEDGWDGWVMRLFDVDPGGHTPKHAHDWPHINFVAAGRGELHLDGEDYALGAGSYAYVPAGHEHQFRAAADEPLSFVCIVPEAGDY